MALRLGQVKFYIRSQKFGFIRCLETNQEYFVHDTAIYADQNVPKYRRYLKDGEYVEFTLDSETGGQTDGVPSQRRGPMVSYVQGLRGNDLMYQFISKRDQERRTRRKQRQQIQQQHAPPPSGDGGGNGNGEQGSAVTETE
jgi:cold shock CspA family protein